jgi:hypothetical protein
MDPREVLYTQDVCSQASSTTSSRVTMPSRDVAAGLQLPAHTSPSPSPLSRPFVSPTGTQNKSTVTVSRPGTEGIEGRGVGKHQTGPKPPIPSPTNRKPQSNRRGNGLNTTLLTSYLRALHFHSRPRPFQVEMVQFCTPSRVTCQFRLLHPQIVARRCICLQETFLHLTRCISMRLGAHLRPFFQFPPIPTMELYPWAMHGLRNTRGLFLLRKRC